MTANIKDHVIIQQIIQYSKDFTGITEADGNGEANVGANVGTEGVGVYEGKDGVILEFRNLVSKSAPLVLTYNATNKTIEFTYDQGQINHQALGGAGNYSHTNIDGHLESTANPHQTAHADLPDKGTNDHAAIDAHLAATDNPHETDFGDLSSTSLATLNSKIGDATLDDISGIRKSDGAIVAGMNKTGAPLAVLDVVYIGSGDGTPWFYLADANTFETSRMIGLSDGVYSDNTEAKAVAFGPMGGLNTGIYPAGTELYLNPAIKGKLTTTKPTGGAFCISVAKVTNQSEVAGTIFVNPHLAEYTRESNFIVGWEKDPLAFMQCEFDKLTRTLTVRRVGSTWNIYEEGEKFIIGTEDGGNPGEYIATYIVPDLEGRHLVYFSNGVLTSIHKPTDGQISTLMRDNPWCVWLVWDKVNQKCIFLGKEPHQFKFNPLSHNLWHFGPGALYQGGLSLNGFSIGNGSLPEHAQFGVDAGQLADEDLFHLRGNVLSTTGIPVVYREGVDGDWRRDNPNGYAVKSFIGGSGLLAFNELVGGTYQQTEATSGRYILCHVFCTNDYWDTVLENDSGHGILAVQGTKQYQTANDAKEGSEEEIQNILNVAGGEESFPMGTVIFQTSAGFGNPIKAAIIEVDPGVQIYQNWLKTVFSQSPPPASHLALNDLDGGAASDGGHSQLAALLGRSGGQVMTGGTSSGLDLILRDNATEQTDVSVKEIRQALDSNSSNEAWNYSTSTGDAFPGNGSFRLNNADRSLATFIYMADLSANGVDMSAILSKVGAGDTFYIQQADDANAAVLYTLSGPAVDATTYWKVPVVFNSQGTNPFVNNKTCQFKMNSYAGGGANKKRETVIFSDGGSMGLGYALNPPGDNPMSSALGVKIPSGYKVVGATGVLGFVNSSITSTVTLGFYEFNERETFGFNPAFGTRVAQLDFSIDPVAVYGVPAQVSGLNYTPPSGKLIYCYIDTKDAAVAVTDVFVSLKLQEV
jgi:hypothetical protein